MAPEVAVIGQTLTFEWTDQKIRITLDRFRDSGRSGATAEVHVTTTAPGYQPHLTQGQLNLVAMNTRSSFSKRLKELYPEASWDEILETVCVLGLRHLRQGEPVLRLSVDADIPAPIHRLSPLVYDGLPTVLFGPGGLESPTLPCSVRCSWSTEAGRPTCVVFPALPSTSIMSQTSPIL